MELSKQCFKILILNFSAQELRSYVDQIYDIRLREVEDPVVHAWQCGRDAAKLGALDDRLVIH